MFVLIIRRVLKVYKKAKTENERFLKLYQCMFNDLLKFPKSYIYDLCVYYILSVGICMG